MRPMVIVIAGWAMLAGAGARADAPPPEEAAPKPEEVAPDFVETPPPTLQVLAEVGGGTVIAFDAAGETGNAFGGALGVRFSRWEILVGGAVALPDSRLQGRFGALWAEGRFLPLGADHFVTPYLGLGVGMALQDAFTGSDTGFIPARWSTSTNLLGTAALGVRFGERRGLYLSADARAWNASHLGLSLIVGFAFL